MLSNSENLPREEDVAKEILYGLIAAFGPANSGESGSQSEDVSEDSDADSIDDLTDGNPWAAHIRFLRDPLALPNFASKSNDQVNGLCGLRNLGNTCYFNAAIQCLSNVAALRSVFLGPKMLHESSRNPGALSQLSIHFTELIKALWSGRFSYISPGHVLTSIAKINPTFRGYMQHDSQELLRSLLDSLHESLKRPIYIENSLSQQQTQQQHQKIPANGNGNSISQQQEHKPIYESPVFSLFEGKLLSTVVCKGCGHASKTIDPFLDLSLSVPSSALQSKISARKDNIEKIKQLKREEERDSSDEETEASGETETDEAGNSKVHKKPGFFGRLGSGLLSLIGMNSSHITLQDCLHGYCVPDELIGEDRYKCENCKTVQDATKTFSIAKFPPVLCIHIKRFKYDFFGSKVTDYIQFPVKNLDMSDFQARPEDNEEDCRNNINHVNTGNYHSSNSHMANGTSSNHTQTSSSPSSSTSSNFNDSNGNGNSNTITSTQSNGLEPSNFDSPHFSNPLYNLSGVICHDGRLSSGHYYAYCKNTIDGQWYLFNDHRVMQVSLESVLQSEAYVLFYEQQSTQKKEQERQRISNSIIQHIEQLTNSKTQNLPNQPPGSPGYHSGRKSSSKYAALTWIAKWLSSNDPGKMTSPGLSCPHGVVIPHLNPAYLVPLSTNAAKHFSKVYGGDLISDINQSCSSCEAIRKKAIEEKQLQLAIQKRREAEFADIKKLSQIKDSHQMVIQGHFWIDAAWIKHWLEFVNSQRDDCPGPIDNHGLKSVLDSGYKPITVRDYRALSYPVWKYLLDIYGGGPVIHSKTPEWYVPYDDSTSPSDSDESE